MRLLRVLAAACCVTVSLALPAVAGAAPPLPFGHACSPTEGVLFCPTPDDAARIPSFDGVPLDVDVTLPGEGDGPFPTILMLHGYGGSKTDFEAPRSPLYNNVFYAQRGYAVVNLSARGFGRSCGKADSRTAGCERGWLHLADQRYEGRDNQLLLGMLVDQGIARADALAATGISYGGGQSLQLAALRNRTRMPDGSFVQWTSPEGVPLSLTAAYPRWPWTDLADSLLPNGRYRSDRLYDPRRSRSPAGVGIKSYVDGLYLLGTIAGYVAPKGVDPTADLAGWRARQQQGEPYGADVQGFLRELQDFHGAGGLLGWVPPPLLIQSGWTDDLFPVTQALRYYDAVRAARPQGVVSLQLGDMGHSRATNRQSEVAQFSNDALGFFDAYLRGVGAPPASGSVKVFRTTCPKTAPTGAAAVSAGSFSELARGSLGFGTTRERRISSAGGNKALAMETNPIGKGSDACRTYPSTGEPGDAVLTRRSPGVTLMGLTRVFARVRTQGRGGQIAARLWDVDPAAKTQQLVDRGVYRLRDDQRGSVTFELDGNAWRFPRGHLIKLQLLGRDVPRYQASRTTFRVRMSALSASLPTRERPGG